MITTISGSAIAQEQPALDVYVANDMWIRSGTLSLAGAGANAIHVGGDFTNDATFASATATIIMDGSQAQTIGGTSISTFNKLTINNTVSTVTLLQDENISSVLTLTEGALVLNSRLLTVQNSATTAVVRTNGYLQSETNSSSNPSKLQWNIGNVNGTYTIPFGVSGTYIPLTFQKTAGTSNMQFSTRATSTSDNTPWASGVTSMWDPILQTDGSMPAVVDRWWDITALSGSSSVTANLTFRYRGSENTLSAPYNTGTLAAQHWNGAAWDPPVGSGAGVTSGVGSVTVSGANSFSPWVISSLTVPLPVELLSFSANCNPGNGSVLVTWTTCSESNNAGFIIERSSDGVNFTEAGIVAGAENSSVCHDYSFIDNDSYSGNSYYRLKQKDFDGTVTAFNIVPVNCSASDAEITAYNNQQGNIVIRISSESNADYMITLFDNTGKKIYTKTLIPDGVTTCNISCDGLSKGIYFIVITDGKETVTKKIYVE
jgi:hypothetical protein